MAKKQTHTNKGKKPPKKHARGHHAKVYWPYIPLVALLLGSAFLNIWQPLQVNQPATLAYATEMSRSGLLSGTNSQRSKNGRSSLSINSKLNAAAQAKAQDMIARDYWSHNTPDGKEPWIFIDAQGYNYQKAGENLAYGFATSNDTIIGWMNSPSHKANLLDSAFTEVGFGFANGEDFDDTGEQTVVVAMYGKPVVKSAQTTTPPPAPEPKPAPASQPQTNSANQETEAEPEESKETIVEEPEYVPVSDERYNQPVNTDTIIPQETESTRITLLQQLTGGNTPWIAIVASVAGFSLAVAWLFKHYVLVRRFVIEGEHFVAHHPVLDFIVVAVVAAIVYLSQSAGVVL